jgi:hypothetical protein
MAISIYATSYLLLHWISFHLPIHRAKPLPISLASVNDEQHNNLALLPVNPIDHSPISYLIPKTPGQSPLESLDVWVLVGILPQTLETAIEFANQNRVSLFVEALRIVG